MHRSGLLCPLLRVWRQGGIVRTALMLVVCALLLNGVMLPFNGVLLPISMLFIGEADLARQSPTDRAPRRLVAWRLVNTLIASTTLLVVTH